MWSFWLSNVEDKTPLLPIVDDQQSHGCVQMGQKNLDESSAMTWLETPMARLLIIKPEAYFHTLCHTVLTQAGYVAIEAANTYEGRPAADVVCLADGRLDRRAPARARLLIVDAETQFHTFSVKSWPRRTTW